MLFEKLAQRLWNIIKQLFGLVWATVPKWRRLVFSSGATFYQSQRKQIRGRNWYSSMRLFYGCRAQVEATLNTPVFTPVEWCIRPNESLWQFSSAAEGKLKVLNVLSQYLPLYPSTVQCIAAPQWMHSLSLSGRDHARLEQLKIPSPKGNFRISASVRAGPGRGNLLIYVPVSQQRMGWNFNQPETRWASFAVRVSRTNWSNAAISVLVFLKA